MKCPFCDNTDSKVINTRFCSNSLSVRRRRLCELCNKRFTTYEKIENIPITVVKRNGNKEPFDESKMMAGIMIATEKRNLSQDILENIVAQVYKQVEDSGKTEISSQELGMMVMSELKTVDAVGYLRFASVYKNFEDLEEFINEIRTMINKE